MHILLDTNILISLVSEPRQEKLIDLLAGLVSSGQIKLLVPEVLKGEWDKKKGQTVENISRLFANSAKHAHSPIFKSQYQDELTILKEKVLKVDTLLNEGLFIELSEMVIVETTKRSLKGIAPFHAGKTKTGNDALLFFSVINYLAVIKEKEFTFITRDSDYIALNTPGPVLHPDLAPANIAVIYAPSLEKGLIDLQELGKITFEEKLSDVKSSFNIHVLSKGNKNFLDYLYEVLLACQQKMRMIPPDIFCRIHPFRILNKKYNYTYYSHYTLQSNNEELLDFFSHVNIDLHKFKAGAPYKNTGSNVAKLKFIIETLNRQFVFSISLVNSDKIITVKPSKVRSCDCTRCLYNKFKWKELLMPSYSSDDPLKLAFVHYQLGFYPKAFKEYYACYEQAKKDNNKILVYQLQYLLKWIRHNVFAESDAEVNKIKGEVDEWDNEKQYFSFSNAPAIDQQLARFFQNANPIRSYQLEIRKHTDSIRKHYNSQLRVSVSSNSNYFNLATEFSVFIEFTMANAMGYTRFSDFSDICKDFTEGVFLSYALNEYQPSRLSEFDDFVLASLLRFGNAEEMIRVYTLYVRKDFLFKSDDGSFKKLTENFLANENSLIGQMEESNAWQGSVHFYSMFWNLIVLLALTKFDKKFILNCFDKLYPFLEVMPKREKHRLNHLSSLIHARGKMLGKDRIKKIFKLCIADPEMHKDELFEAFSVLAMKHSFKLVTTDEEFDEFCQYFLDVCAKCNNYHHNILFNGYDLLVSSFQKKLGELIVKKLETKQDFNLYYLSALKDIIDYNLFFEDYLALYKNPGNVRRPSFFDLEAELQFRELNNLMNLAFKNKVKLPEVFVSKMKGISDYYDWLLNIERFDYKKFNPLWIIQYPTMYYLEKIFSISKIRKLVRIYLKTNNQPTLSYYYSQYVK